MFAVSVLQLCLQRLVNLRIFVQYMLGCVDVCSVCFAIVFAAFAEVANFCATYAGMR